MKLNEPNILKVRMHQVFLRKKIKPVRVMTTGDWHVSPIVSEQQFEFLKEAIAEADPDIIILQGDLIDSPIELRRETSLKKLARELKLCAATAPTVLVLGSHDYITPTRPPKNMQDVAIQIWRKICKKCGIKLLLDEWVKFDGIRIFGAFQDPRCMIYKGKNGELVHRDSPAGFNECLEDVDDLIKDEVEQKFDGVTWFAAHAPLLNEDVIKKLAPFDIASFGHTHGGIVPLGLDEIFDKLNLHFGLISPNHTPFPRNVRGATPISDSTMLVVNPGMIATHFCTPKILQNMNFIKAAEISVIEVSEMKEAPEKTKETVKESSDNVDNNAREPKTIKPTPKIPTKKSSSEPAQEDLSEYF